MKTRNIVFTLIAMIISTNTFAKGGDSGGQGGLAKYGDQFYFIAHKLQKELSNTYPLLDTLLNSHLSIRPTLEELKVDGNNVDMLSYSIDSDGKKVNVLPFNGNDGVIRVVRMQMASWDKMACRSKHLLVLHELLVHLGIEKSQDYHASTVDIDALSKAGNLSCVGMPEIVELPPTGSTIKKGCPRNLVEGILTGSKALSSSASRLINVADFISQYGRNVRQEEHTNFWNQEVPTGLIEQSAQALALNYLARLCIDFMNDQPSKALADSIHALKIPNDTMVKISFEAMNAIKESMEPLVNIGLNYSQDLLSNREYEDYAKRILVEYYAHIDELNNQWTEFANEAVTIVRQKTVSIRLASVTDAYKIYYGAIYAGSITKTLIGTAQEYKNALIDESLF